MASTDAPVGDAWRAFFREEAAADVRSFVSAGPEERSLYVDVFDLHRFDADLVDRLFSDPDGVLRAGAEALRGAHDDVDRVNLRLRNLPSQLSLGAVRARHVSKLVSVDGLVEAVGPVEAAAAEATFVCGACGATERTRPLGMQLAVPGHCTECGATGTVSLDRDRSRFVDVQRVVLGGPDDDQSMAVFLDDDLVDTVEPGESLRVTGVVRLSPHEDENRFAFYLDGLTVDEQAPGPSVDDRDVDEQLKESIRSRWEFVVGE